MGENELDTKDRRVFSCKRCPESFKYKMCLKKHFNKKHGEDAVDPKKLHECGQCAVTFPTLGHLTDHVNSKHKGLKCHKCSQCPAKYGWRSTLLWHLKTAHKIGAKALKKRHSANDEVKVIRIKSLRHKKARIHNNIQDSDGQAKGANDSFESASIAQSNIDNTTEKLNGNKVSKENENSANASFRALEKARQTKELNASFENKNLNQSNLNSPSENVNGKKVSNDDEGNANGTLNFVDKGNERNDSAKNKKTTLLEWTTAIPDELKLNNRSDKMNNNSEEATNAHSGQQSADISICMEKLSASSLEINIENKTATAHPTRAHDGPLITEAEVVVVRDHDAKEGDKSGKSTDPGQAPSERDQLMNKKEQLVTRMKALDQDEVRMESDLNKLREKQGRLEKDLKIKRLNKSQLMLELEKYKVELGED